MLRNLSLRYALIILNLLNTHPLKMVSRIDESDTLRRVLLQTHRLILDPWRFHIVSTTHQVLLSIRVKRTSLRHLSSNDHRLPSNRSLTHRILTHLEGDSRSGNGGTIGRIEELDAERVVGTLRSQSQIIQCCFRQKNTGLLTYPISSSTTVFSPSITWPNTRNSSGRMPVSVFFISITVGIT